MYFGDYGCYYVIAFCYAYCVVISIMIMIMVISSNTTIMINKYVSHEFVCLFVAVAGAGWGWEPRRGVNARGRTCTRGGVG